VEVAPTGIEAGLALIFTVATGTAETVTFATAVALPPLPVAVAV
jgi:hypothetical protein